MRTNLTPERKAVREAQESKWFDGYAGGAMSWPYRVKRYLSKEFSDKIRTEVQAKCAEWIEKLDSIKPAKRFNHHSWCEELDPQYCCFERDSNAIPTKVCGHTIYVKILDNYRKGNGQMGIKAMERPILFISSYYNSPVNRHDWHEVGEQLNFEICWDAENERYYICDYFRASTPEIKITRKNWGRGRCKAKFMNEVKWLEQKLESEGVTIGKITKYTGWYKRGLESYYVDCVNSEITA